MAADANEWAGKVSRVYRKLLIGNAVEKSEEKVTRNGNVVQKVLRKGMKEEAGGSQDARATMEIPFATMLRCRVRYFTDGAVIGSRTFVNEAFAKSRERFGAKRKDGARKLRGSGAPVAGVLWSVRDLRLGI
jgi:hypothetical protein